jgi:hypothetical protein
MLYQQGDVLLESANEIPKVAKRVEANNGNLILAEGEVTGHFHAIEAQHGVDLFKDGDNLFLSNTKTVDIKHQEHHKVCLPAGTWKVRRVQEYDHFTEEARQVKD